MDFSMFLITFREGLEAYLIIAVALAFLHPLNHPKFVQALYVGTGIATAASVGLAYYLAKLGGLGAAWEAGLALLAAILVISCVWHMLKHGKHMKQKIIAGLEKARHQPKAYWAICAFAILMVGREGLEASVMLASLAQQGNMQYLFISGVLGLCSAIVLASVAAHYSKRLNLSLIFQVTGIFMSLYLLE